MSALLRDLRFALRMLVKSPGYTLVAVLTLAFAIGANTALFSAVNHVLLRPLPYPESDQLVTIVETKPEFGRMAVPYPNYIDYRTESTAFTTLAGLGLHVMSLTGKGDAENILLEMASYDLLPMLGVTPMLGRHFTPEEDAPRGPRAVLLSHALWTRRYAADPAMVGRSVTLDGGEWTVVGVLPPDFRPFPFPQVAVFIPLGARADEAAFTDRAARPEIYLVGRIKPELTLAQARADLQAIGDELGRRFPEQVGSSRPLVLPLHAELVSDVRVLLLLLLGAVGCVLLIAAANIANLTLERAMSRQRELGIRAALGAGRWRLIRQQLVESLVLALAGGALGLLFALWGVDGINAVRPNSAAFTTLAPIEVDTAALIYTAVVALGTGLLFGLAPALFASQQDLAQVLKNADHHASAGGRHLHARNLLVVAEVALALMLGIAACLGIRGLTDLQRVDLGFDADNLLFSAITLTPDRYPTTAEVVQFWTAIERRVAAIPGIVSVTASSGGPGLVGGYETFYPIGVARSPEHSNVALAYRVDVGFNETLKIPLLAGRTCGPQDGPGTPMRVVIDRSIADKFFPGQDPVGQSLQDDRSKQASLEIIGVVGHVKADGPDAPERTPYQMQYCYQQLSLSSQKDNALGMTMHLLARSDGDPMLLESQVRAALAEVDPLVPSWGVQSLASSLEGALTSRRFTTQLLGLFAAVALLLAAVGLYAVMANNVARRTHELGVRMALGAQPRAVVALVVRQGLKLVAAGVVLGLLGALALTQVMTSLLTERVGATDPPTYLGVTTILAIVCLLATYLPARRTTRVDPMVALRHE